jgi:transketolase
MTKTPGVDMTTGSLGQGISAAVGMAIAARLLRRSFRVYALIGDGEFQEGQVWEALMCAGARKLDNLVCIMDFNRLQLASTIAEALPIDPVAEKWQAFGWHTVECDGHDIRDVLRGIGEALRHRGGPSAVIARTVKGRGVSFMENVVKWHSQCPSREEVRAALEELGATEEEVRAWR